MKCNLCGEEGMEYRSNCLHGVCWGRASGQEVMFYALQLQFLAMTRSDLRAISFGFYDSSVYKDNAFTNKFETMLFKKKRYDWSEDDHACVSTHLALQMSGLE